MLGWGAPVALQVFDIETGMADEKLNLNPEGWIPGVTKEKDWLVRNMLAPSNPCNGKACSEGSSEGATSQGLPRVCAGNT